MEGIVDFHRGLKALFFLAVRPYFLDYFEWSHFLVIQLLQWSRGLDIEWQKPHNVS